MPGAAADGILHRLRTYTGQPVNSALPSWPMIHTCCYLPYMPVCVTNLARGTLSAIALGDNRHFPEHTAKMLHLGRLPFNQWSIQYQSVGNRCGQTKQHLQLIIQSPNGL